MQKEILYRASISKAWITASGSVDHDLPTHVVIDQPADFVRGWRTSNLASQVYAKLLQDLRAQKRPARSSTSARQAGEPAHA